MDKKNKNSIPYHHGDLKAALIKHSILIINKEGISKLTLRKAARHAGVSHAAPAHHFKDLRGLLAAIAAEGFRRLGKDMETGMKNGADDDPLKKFKALGMTYIEFALRNPSFFKVMYHSMLSDKSLYPELEIESMLAFERMSEMIRACQEKNMIRAGDVSELSLFAWSAVHGFATLAADGQIKSKNLNFDVQQYADTMTSLVYIGLHKV